MLSQILRIVRTSARVLMVSAFTQTPIVIETSFGKLPADLKSVSAIPPLLHYNDDFGIVGCGGMAPYRQRN